MSSSTTMVLPSIAVPQPTDLTALWQGTNMALQQMNRQFQQLTSSLNVTKNTVTSDGSSGGASGISIYPLDANSVGTTQLVDTSIINSKIAANAVQTANILDSAITTLKIANAAVTNAQVAVNTITGGLTGNLASATITAYNIVAQTITAGQIAAATILGSNIAASTITGGNIAALTITASNIASATITATQIAAGTIVGSNIAAGTITANLLSVTQLASITADLGSITAGNITLSSTGYIRGGQTGYNTGIGFWLGYSGNYVFSIGNGGSNALTWNGSTLALSGTITATSGTIGGFSINTSNISAGSGSGQIVLNSTGSIVIGTGTTGYTTRDYSGYATYDSSGNHTTYGPTSVSIVDSVLGNGILEGSRLTFSSDTKIERTSAAWFKITSNLNIASSLQLGGTTVLNFTTSPQLVSTGIHLANSDGSKCNLLADAVAGADHTFGNYISIFMNGGQIWIPYLTSAP